MRGRKGCYSSGGKVRDIGGVRAPEYGSNRNVMREAHGKTTGIIGMGGVRVDGEAKRGRIDKPARRVKVDNED